MEKLIKLNLGCGDDLLESFINVDLFNEKAEVRGDVSQLPFKDNYADEIFASHIIEHFDFYFANNVLKEWYRVLKPGGKLIIETPDFVESCKKFLTLFPNERIYMWGHFFAKPWVEGEIHKFLYDVESLSSKLGNIGFREFSLEPPTKHLEHPNIRIVCLK